MNDRRFSGEIERLRNPERVARLEIDRVITLSTEGLTLASVLDIGTGSGLFAEAFSAKGLQVTGVDLREDMLEAARQFVPQGDFRLAHMEQLPFPDQAFDLVFMGLVLHEADDLQNALKAAYRVAKKRVMVLEWPYEVGEFGPPQDHRLPTEAVMTAAQNVGFAHVDSIALTYMHGFRLDR